jgi:hypothetical protein
MWSSSRISWTFSFLVLCHATLCIAAIDDVTNTTAQTTHGAVTATTEATDTKVKTGSDGTEYKDLTRAMKNGIVTLEFTAENVSDISVAQQSVKSSVIKILNRPSPTPDGVTAEAAAAEYSEDGVTMVAADPAIEDGTLRVPLIAQNKGGEVLDAETLKEKLESNKGEISADTGLPVGKVYVGLPADLQPEPQKRRSIWDQHYWMFICVLVLLAIALLTLLLCCLCFRCHSRRKHQTKQLDESKQQVPVEEMIVMNKAAPVQHSAPPPMSEGPNSHTPLAADEENGWIIPIDQLSPEELEQPDVQISRL